MTTGTNRQSLEAEIRALAPWHLDVRVRPDLSIGEVAGGVQRDETGRRVVMVADEARFAGLLRAVYPAGLAGRRFLDVACNCGAYCFWARQEGAGTCFGFDVREHWIRQAEFLRRHGVPPSEDIAFRQRDLFDVPSLGLAPFDITLFKGILYHLADPIAGLRIAADLTTELLIVNSATRGSTRAGWVMETERPDVLMNGVHRLNWYPTGPGVVENVLRWLGFTAFRRVFWHRRAPFSGARGPVGWLKARLLGTGRFELLAARSESAFAAFDRARAFSAR